ncbi:MAG: hypothetical protein AABY22_35810 [Nanoarchaeota archaeon]
MLKKEKIDILLFFSVLLIVIGVILIFYLLIPKPASTTDKMEYICSNLKSKNTNVLTFFPLVDKDINKVVRLLDATGIFFKKSELITYSPDDLNIVYCKAVYDICNLYGDTEICHEDYAVTALTINVTEWELWAYQNKVRKPPREFLEDCECVETSDKSGFVGIPKCNVYNCNGVLING